ncbi:urocanate hydratase [Leucobacter ruminantium]|uniref:Urocanate hydratase n=1 Tax=Leucobacter ruminantium TaxID=1289170 RepID=A0A939LUE3_9MICO|nr:urocanate hydratase [Leucobacter ruminantium]MBO1804566.1 urocanate hydratase [Leucobacter ruminantium]
MTETSTILARGGERIRAGRGTALRARNWRAEALLRMFENVLEVGERPEALIVYASLGKAARNWDEACRIVEALLVLEEDETLVLQTGAAVGVMRTREASPMVLSAVNNTVGRWAGSDRFYERARAGQTIWGGLTAAAWQYIGRQGVLGGTYELLRVIANRHFGGEAPENLARRWMLTAGMGGMGSAQPISASMLGLSSITVEIDPAKARKLLAAGGIDVLVDDPDEAANALFAALEAGEMIHVGLLGNAAEAFEHYERRGLVPDIVTDQTAAHDPRYGYAPVGYGADEWIALREEQPERIEREARASIARQVNAILGMAERGSVAFENGNNLRVQAVEHLGEESAERVYRIPGFMEAYLRPLFARGIGPFRWVCLSGDIEDQRIIDELAASLFPERPEIARWIGLARERIPQQGLPARSCWLGHGERSRLARAVNELVASGELSAPVLFSRDHLDSAGMTHPRIGTEGMRDGSDGVTDWPLLDAMLLSTAGADLVAIHSGGGGYAGWMQSAGVSIVADGRPETAERLTLALDLDSGLGVLRHAQAGYEEARGSASQGGETGDAPIRWLGASCTGEEDHA